MFQPLASWKNKTKKTKGFQQGDTQNAKEGRKKNCEKNKKNLKEREIWERERARERQTEWESEKEKTQKCGPPGLYADTGEGLQRGGAWPYGCMAKWNPRGGSGHISLHGALHRFLCTAVCGTHRNIDNDIRLSHLCDGSWIPADIAGERPGGGKITCSALWAQSYLCHSIMTQGPLQKQQTRWSWKGWDWSRSPGASASLAPFKQQRRES